MKFSFLRWLSTASLTAAALMAAPAHAAPFSGLFVFGDSLSDPGNNAAFLLDPPFSLTPTAPAEITDNTFVPTLPYASRTYTNGDVWAQSVASALGVPGGAAFGPGGGTNFAFGGAETSQEVIPLGFPSAPPSLRSQTDLFLAFTGGVAPSDGLYVVEGGGNNLRRLLPSLLSVDLETFLDAVAAEAAAYAADVGGIVDDLQAAGAKDIIVWNTPNAGLIPASLVFGDDFSLFASFAAIAFNDALAERLSGEVGVQTFDVFGLLTAAAEFPSSFGLTNVSDACGNPALGCDIDTSLFWDGIHPTAAGHALLARGFLAVAVPIPEPSTYALMLVGLAGCAFAARRRSTRTH